MQMCWGSGGRDPQTLNIGVTLRSGVNFKLCLLYPGKIPRCPFNTGPRAGVFAWRKQKSLPLQEKRPPVVHTANTHVTARS
jgi:hypothetical protein